MRYMMIYMVMFTITLPFAAHAQDAATAPIFISPYTQSATTYPSAVPSIVQTKPNDTRTNSMVRNGARPYTQSGRVSTGDIYDMANPLDNTPFGRVMEEMNYYDAVTKQYYNQYDYMGLLAQRGDLVKLSETSTYLQQNGVFDPNKYQAAITAARNGTTLSAQSAEGGSSTGTDGQAQPRVFIVKPQTPGDTPQKIHQGYDDNDAATPAPSKRPIFMQ